MAVEDLINQALRRIGYQTPIGSVYDGSPAARVALEVYGQTRDDLLRLLRPVFARRNANLTLLKTAPPGGYGIAGWTADYPPPPWMYEYGYPADCIDLRAVRQAPTLIPSFLPVATLFTLANDASLVPPAKVILTNLPRAIAVYTAQVTDMTTWDSTFTEAIVSALAVRMGQAMNAAPDAVKGEVGEEQAAAGGVMQRRG